MTNNRLVRDSLGWGFAIWLIGYVLAMVLFFVLPTSLIGWVINPIGIVLTLWVLLKKIHASDIRHYATVAVIWTMMAVALDYLFIVKALHPSDGYYKADVYLYYSLTFVMPLAVGWWKATRLPRQQLTP